MKDYGMIPSMIDTIVLAWPVLAGDDDAALFACGPRGACRRKI
jgi:hypothetical protein